MFPIPLQRETCLRKRALIQVMKITSSNGIPSHSLMDKAAGNLALLCSVSPAMGNNTSRVDIKRFGKERLIR
jgi:hypothetical protein